MRRLVILCVCVAGARAQDPGFQPSAPYHATFFYPWYPQWTDGGHAPPLNWFSNYLPDPYPHIFDPAAELYSSTDDAIIYWQLRKLAEAHQEVAISSWWGMGHKTDPAFRHILLDVMDRDAVLKVYAGYRTDPNQPDSWHQYAPALRTDDQAPYSYLVSPGFWLDGQAPRLERDLEAFRRAVLQMVAAPVTWKLVETWNEWSEGTAVEPGDPVIQSKTGAAMFDPNGAPFQNLYVEALGKLLPPLEQGTGAPLPRPPRRR